MWPDARICKRVVQTEPVKRKLGIQGHGKVNRVLHKAPLLGPMMIGTSFNTLADSVLGHYLLFISLFSHVQMILHTI